jgi:hypothetical protein
VTAANGAGRARRSARFARVIEALERSGELAEQHAWRAEQKGRLGDAAVERERQARTTGRRAWASERTRNTKIGTSPPASARSNATSSADKPRTCSMPVSTCSTKSTPLPHFTICGRRAQAAGRASQRRPRRLDPAGCEGEARRRRHDPLPPEDTRNSNLPLPRVPNGAGGSVFDRALRDAMMTARWRARNGCVGVPLDDGCASGHADPRWPF